MLEIELFQREPSCGVHTLKIWANGQLVHASDVCSLTNLVELRDALHNELLWLNHYLREQGLEESNDKL